MEQRITALQGDITKMNVDAIVNAANKTLMGGGGVDGAIHRAAGPELLRECVLLNGCCTGQAKVTRGYSLPAKYVIHTVGPIYGADADPVGNLAACYRNCLCVAHLNHVHSLAFPCISTGVYGFPKEKAARIAFETVRAELKKYPEITSVIFCCFSFDQLALYQTLLQS
ncbi:MAG: O-acetyl-ADP-ribose deacetylase [Bacteroidaceae bacterium]|jgi:O-acetyl-ADP-ribose deacetylase (regulator of RNase III)